MCVRNSLLNASFLGQTTSAVSPSSLAFGTRARTVAYASPAWTWATHPGGDPERDGSSSAPRGSVTAGTNEQPPGETCSQGAAAGRAYSGHRVARGETEGVDQEAKSPSPSGHHRCLGGLGRAGQAGRRDSARKAGKTSLRKQDTRIMLGQSC